MTNRMVSYITMLCHNPEYHDLYPSIRFCTGKLETKILRHLIISSMKWTKVKSSWCFQVAGLCMQCWTVWQGEAILQHCNFRALILCNTTCYSISLVQCLL